MSLPSNELSPSFVSVISIVADASPRFTRSFKLVLRDVLLALLPKPIARAARIADFPLPFSPTKTLTFLLRATWKFEWHMKFLNEIDLIFPLFSE